MRLLRAAEKERRLRQASEQQREENAACSSSLQERKHLLERLSRIQSSIVSRRALTRCSTASSPAPGLLGDETVGLRLVDPDDPQTLIMVASAGVDEDWRKRNAAAR